MKLLISLFVTLAVTLTSVLAPDMILPESVTNLNLLPTSTVRKLTMLSFLHRWVRALDEGTYEGSHPLPRYLFCKARPLKHATARRHRPDASSCCTSCKPVGMCEQLSVVYFTEQGELYEADRSV